MTRIKICGITRREDAELAISLGAHALGMVREPSSPRYVREVPDWWLDLAPYVVRVAVYGPWTEEPQVEAFDRFQAVSWSGSPPPANRRVQVVRIGSPTGPQAELPPHTAVHLDAYSDLAFGGTGKFVDLEQAAEFVRGATGPIILAGGLTPENVGEAIRKVRPYAVDVSSGVESSPGHKDARLMREFFRAVQLA